jgi:hypothetical protein
LHVLLQLWFSLLRWALQHPGGRGDSLACLAASVRLVQSLLARITSFVSARNSASASFASVCTCAKRATDQCVYSGEYVQGKKIDLLHAKTLVKSPQ